MSVDVKYTTQATAMGGRDGWSKLASGMLSVAMASPAELGGSGKGHNPEELFALGYSACFLGAMRVAAANEKLGTIPDDASVTADVGIGPRGDGGFGITVKLTVTMPGVERATAEKMIERGHFVCPYSNATKGNIAVETVLA